MPHPEHLVQVILDSARADEQPGSDLEKDREPFDRESESEHRPECADEPRLQKSHLEAQHRAGDHADREQRDHHLRPAPREREIQLIAAPVPSHSTNSTIAGNEIPNATTEYARRTTAPASAAPAAGSADLGGRMLPRVIERSSHSRVTASARTIAGALTAIRASQLPVPPAGGR